MYILSSTHAQVNTKQRELLVLREEEDRARGEIDKAQTQIDDTQQRIQHAEE